MAGETATVRIFSTDVHLHARKIHFDTVFDDFKGQVMIFQITVDHYEELDAGPGRADRLSHTGTQPPGGAIQGRV